MHSIAFNNNECNQLLSLSLSLSVSLCLFDGTLQTHTHTHIDENGPFISDQCDGDHPKDRFITSHN